MTVLIIILILIILGIGIFIGYKAGIYFIHQQNQTIIMQNNLLQQYSNQWASAARSTHQLSAEIAGQQVTNTTATLQTVILMLQAIQQGQAQTMGNEQREAIQKLLNDARAISPTSEFE